MEGVDTPEDLADFLQMRGISTSITEILRQEEISGEDFLDLTEKNLKSMGIKMGPVKQLLRIQAEYKPQLSQEKKKKKFKLKKMIRNTFKKKSKSSQDAPSNASSTTSTHHAISTKPNLEKEPKPEPNPISPYAERKDFSLAIDILKDSTKVVSEPGEPQVFKLPTLPEADPEENDVIMCPVGKPGRWMHISRHRVVMVVGATGAGKTTLINGMANYLFGVEWRDNFRFKLIADDEEGGNDQATSKAKHIIAYYFPWHTGSKVPYGLTIIDTPGFGDTGGLKEDKRTFHQIRQLFMNPAGIHQLDAIGFVTQSSLGRLTPTQQYIFDSILSIFGKDIGDNIFLMATFADAHKPPVLDAVNKAGIKYQASFRFNNSALFVDNEQETENGNFDEMFWKMGMRSFESFFNHIGKIETKSLLQTREVLIEREQLQILVQGLQPQIQLGLAKIDEFRQEERVVKEHEAEISISKDFKYEVKVKKQKVISLIGQGVFTTNCLQCNYTCHNGCAFSKDEDKIRCRAMKNGYCTVCTKKCKWDQHRNTPYRYEWYDVVETRTSEDLQRRYSIATSGKSKVESLMASLESDLKMMRQVVLQMVHQTKKCLQRLSEIALKPNPLTEVEYIDMLIVTEEQECRLRYRERIRALTDLRKEAELLSRMSDVKIEQYIKTTDHKSFFDQLHQGLSGSEQSPQ
jgi:energy-coupling factor transporter ATP-binding protein EcfA2